MPGGLNALKEVANKLHEKGVKVYGISSYDIRNEEKKNPVILLGYANMSEEKIKRAVEALIEAWGDIL